MSPDGEDIRVVEKVAFYLNYYVKTKKSKKNSEKIFFTLSLHLFLPPFFILKIN